MTETGSKYSERQIGLIEGSIQPDTEDEWKFIQNHANDVLPDQAAKTTEKRPGYVIIPPGKDLNLHKPKDIGTPRWQEQQEKNG